MNIFGSHLKSSKKIYVFLILIIPFFAATTLATEVFLPTDILKTKRCTEKTISPDGKWVAYTVSVPRNVNDEPGSAYRELFVISLKNGSKQPFITGKVSIRSPEWSPDSSRIAFLKRGGKKGKTQVWVISVHGGESKQITHAKTGVLGFKWHPVENKIVYITSTQASKREKKLEKKGFGFIFYEENLKHRNLCMIDLDKTGGKTGVEQLTKGITVWDFVFAPDGKKIAAAVSKKNLIDHRYMFRKVFILDLKSKKRKQLTDNPGKLGNYRFSPDGKKLVYTASLDRKDHSVSQVYVLDLPNRKPKNLTIPDFRGHVKWAGWKDNQTVVYLSYEGVWPTLSTVNFRGGKRKIILDSKKTGVMFNVPDYTSDFKNFVMIGSSPEIPADLYFWKPGKPLKRLTNVNPWISGKKLGKQKVIHYKARDGLEIEGILIYPVNEAQGKKYPLIVVVHGGPESNYRNSWITRYSSPGQVLSGKGYLVFYPNYRASTGYGVKFALEGFEDPAGKEFDDIADGIEYLIKLNIADPVRIGLGGGSYGGYASAWFASYYTKYVRAVCMFVGISDLISKRGTTDIPYEELYVHSNKKLEKMWEFSLKRSPLYWAHQSKTAVLIYGGTDDTRVHPSQSLEFYRRLKMNDHPAVRLVQYPGEGHGNRKHPGRIDVMYRQLQWYDWYVRDLKPLDGPMPSFDISDKYGLDLKD